MAKATLPTNFKDDILASSMGSKRRYNVINNSDGTISLEDVTTYTQVGSTFGAAQINATNAAANAAADASKIIDDYETLMANTQAGYMAGALAVKQLNSDLGGNVKFDLSMGTINSSVSEIRYSNIYDSNYFTKENNTIKALKACKIKIYGGAICGNTADDATTTIYKNGTSILSQSTQNTSICLEVSLNIGDVLSFSLSGYRVTGRFFALC